MSFPRNWLSNLRNQFKNNRRRRHSRPRDVESRIEALEDRKLLTSMIYVDDNFANPVLGQDPDGDGPATEFGVDAFATIQQGVNVVDAGGTLNINAGVYAENVTIAKNITLDGSTGNAGEVVIDPTAGDGITIIGGNVAISDLTVQDAVDGIHQSGGGGLTLENVRLTGNTGAGAVVENAASFSDTDSVISGNANHGIQLLRIGGDVALTGTTLEDNDADNDGVGDGLHAERDVQLPFRFASTLAAGDNNRLFVADGSQFYSVNTDLSSPEFIGGHVSNSSEGWVFDGVNLLSVTGADNQLRTIDPTVRTTFPHSVDTLSSVPITLAGERVAGGTGLAIDPTSGTLYALLELLRPNSTRLRQDTTVLVTVDRITGVSTRVGDTGDRFESITFDSVGTLYGVTTDSLVTVTPYTLFTLSTVDATATVVRSLPRGNSQNSLAFNPADGLIYSSRGGSGGYFQTIDPATAETRFVNPAIGGNLTITDARFSDSDAAGSTGHQQRGVSVDGPLVGEVTLTNVVATGNRDRGVSISEVFSNVTVAGGTYTDNVDDGLRISEVNGSVSVSGGSFVNNGDDGTSIVEVFGDVTITGGARDNNGDDGLVISQANGAVNIDGGSYTGNGDDGASIRGPLGDVTVDGGNYTNNSDDGLSIQDAAGNVNVTGGSYTVNGDDGVSIHRPNGNVTISGGTYNNNVEDGLDAQDVGENLDITGGAFSNNGSDGISVDFSAGTVRLTDVTADNNLDDGLDLYNVDVIEIRSSTASGNGEIGVKADEGGSVDLIDVTADRNGEIGLRRDRGVGATTVTRSSFSDNAIHGISLNRITDVGLTDVTVTGNDSSGLIVLDSDSVSIQQSVFTGNDFFAIDLRRIAQTAEVSSVNVDANGIGLNFNMIAAATVESSTFSNSAFGSGISSFASSLEVSNSTVSGNSSATAAGGINAIGNGSLTVSNSTITNNRVDSNGDGNGTGGGILANGPTVLLQSTIVAGNVRGAIGADVPDDLSGTLDPAGSFNLIGSGDGSTGLVDGVNGNQVGTASSLIDPLIGPLQDNGGPAPTHEVLLGSPAVDAGSNPLNLTFDQRGFARVLESAADVGAFESIANHPPVAVSQNIAVLEDELVNITLSGDDGNLQITQSLTFAIESGPSHGAISGFNPATGEVIYTPNADYNGSDSFSFTVTDDDAARGPALTSSPARVEISIVAVNDVPIADPQNVSTPEDRAVAITLTGVDGDSDVAQTLMFAIVDEPANGTLSDFNPATGAVIYTPNADYNGPDSFTFRVIDDNTAGGAALNSSPVSVQINLQPVNDAPNAQQQRVSTSEETALPITLSGADGDVEIAQSLTFAIETGPSHGTLSGFDPATGEVVYIPNADYNGPDSFTFIVTDDGTAGGPALTSSPASVQISVAAVNDAPSARPQSVSTSEETALPISLSGADGDAEVAQSLTFAIENGPSNGTLSGFDPATGAVIYTPNAGYNGPDDFSFSVVDDGTAGGAALNSSPATIDINISAVNGRPLAASQNVSVSEDSALPVSLVGSDGDSEVVQSLTFAIVSGPSNGTLTGFNPATGEVVYTPNADYNGPDSFTFSVTDDDTANGPARTSSPATIAVNVSSINDRPSTPIDLDSAANEVVAGSAVGTPVGIAANSSDLESPALSYRLTNDAGGRFGIDSQTGVVSVANGALPGGLGTHTITVEAGDDDGGVVSADFDINVLPLAVPTLTGPVGPVTSNGGAVTINWSGSNGVAGYELLIYDVDAGREFANPTGITGTSYEANFRPGTYQVFARATNASQITGYSTPIEFEVDGGRVELVAPTLTGPAGTVNAGEVEITWNAVAGAADYELLIYNFHEGELIADPTGITGTSYRGNFGPGTYQVFARATDGAGTATNYSAALFFDVAGAAALTVPTLVGPTGTVNAGEVTIEWNAATGAADYELLIYNFHEGELIADPTGITGTSYRGNFAAGITYQVFVRATDGAGTVSNYSAELRFDVADSAAATVPTLTGPAGAAGAGLVPITWSGVSGAASYELWIYNKDEGSEFARVAGLTGTSYTPSSEFLAGNRYQAFVRAVDDSGNVGAFSAPLEFDVVSAQFSIEDVIEDATPEGVLPQDQSAAARFEAPIDLTDAVFTSLEADVESPAVSIVETTVEARPAAVRPAEKADSTVQLDSVLAGWDATDWWNDASANMAESNDAEHPADPSLMIVAAAVGVAVPVIRHQRKRKAGAHNGRRLQ